MRYPLLAVAALLALIVGASAPAPLAAVDATPEPTPEYDPMPPTTDDPTAPDPGWSCINCFQEDPIPTLPTPPPEPPMECAVVALVITDQEHPLMLEAAAFLDEGEGLPVAIEVWEWSEC